jgi:unsaturated rhamnogalacturonyl hydrolase
MQKHDIKAILKKVTQYTIANPYERDYWEKSPALNGVLVWENEADIKAIQSWIDRAVETQNSAGFLNYGDPIRYSAGHAPTLTPSATLPSALGLPLLRFYQRTGDKEYLDAAQRQIDALMATKRTSDGGFWSRMEGPELWIDYLYMMCPFLILHGQITKNQKYIDEAFAQYEVHVKHLVDPEHHLARHAWCETPNSYPQSTFWSRGNGWLITCSVDMLALCPDHPKAGFVADTCRKALAAIEKHQDRSGFLRHVLDDPLEQIEASGTLMFAYAIARANQLGILDNKMMDSALRAFNVVVGSVEPSGAVPGVAVPPGGPGVPFGTTLFGQGFFMLAAHALRDKLKI